MSKRTQVRKKWIRYESKYSNSPWHTDWTLIEGMGWLIAYEDDASRFIVGYGLFPEATSEHSLEVLKQAIGEHGKPRRSSRTGEYSSILSRQTTD